MINVEEIRNAQEKKINKRIEEIDNPNLSDKEKRLIVLNEMNSSNYNQDFIFFPNNIIKIIDIEKIRMFKNKQIEEKVMGLKDENLSYKEKLLKILDEINSSISSEIPYSNEDKIVPNEKLLNDDSTREYSNITSDISFLTEANNLSKLQKEKIDYWIKYELYDAEVQNIPLKNLITYDLDKDKKILCYLYSNKLITYYFIKNIKFGKDYSINDKIIKDKEYYESYGLFFCGKKIEIEKNEIQTCLPDKMICINCMDKNRKRYNLENTYLININGRVAIEYKGHYHCFGHFLDGNQIENCIQKFSCKACKLLDKYEKYYFPS